MDIDTINKVMLSDELNKSEKMVLEWYLDYQYGGDRLGAFFTKLFNAMSSADMINRERFRQGFAEEFEAFDSWTRGDMSDRVNAIAGKKFV